MHTHTHTHISCNVCMCLQALKAEAPAAKVTAPVTLTAEDEELYKVTPEFNPQTQGTESKDLDGDEMNGGDQTVEDSNVQSGTDDQLASQKPDEDGADSAACCHRDKERRSRSRTYDSDSDSGSSSDDSDVIADRAALRQTEENSVDFESSVNEKRMQAMKSESGMNTGKPVHDLFLNLKREKKPEKRRKKIVGVYYCKDHKFACGFRCFISVFVVTHPCYFFLRTI